MEFDSLKSDFATPWAATRLMMGGFFGGLGLWAIARGRTLGRLLWQTPLPGDQPLRKARKRHKSSCRSLIPQGCHEIHMVSDFRYPL